MSIFYDKSDCDYLSMIFTLYHYIGELDLGKNY